MWSSKSTFLWKADPPVHLYAGGIIFYDARGLWVIKEYWKSNWVYTDCGGKYERADSHIYNTIAREFQEETYFAFPLTGETLFDLKSRGKLKEEFVIYNSMTNSPTYMLLMVNLADHAISFDPKRFLEKREECMAANKHNGDPYYFYPSFELEYMTFAEVPQKVSQFSYRLKQIFYKTFLRTYLRGAAQ